MSRSVPSSLLAFALVASGCFDLSELDRAGGVGVGSASTECPAPDVPEGAGEGSLIRNLQLKDGDRAKVPLYDGCGKVTILGIGAGWCVGCRAEMPEFVHWQAEAPDDLSVYYVLWQDDLSQPASSTFAADWVEEYDANFPVVTDPTGMVRNTYAPSLDLPTTILIDRSMVIRKIRFYSSVERLRFDLDELLEE